MRIFAASLIGLLVAAPVAAQTPQDQPANPGIGQRLLNGLVNGQQDQRDPRSGQDYQRRGYNNDNGNYRSGDRSNEGSGDTRGDRGSDRMNGSSDRYDRDSGNREDGRSYRGSDRSYDNGQDRGGYRDDGDRNDNRSDRGPAPGDDR